MLLEMIDNTAGVENDGTITITTFRCIFNLKIFYKVFLSGLFLLISDFITIGAD